MYICTSVTSLVVHAFCILSIIDWSCDPAYNLTYVDQLIERLANQSKGRKGTNGL